MQSSGGPAAAGVETTSSAAILAQGLSQVCAQHPDGLLVRSQRTNTLVNGDLVVTLASNRHDSAQCANKVLQVRKDASYNLITAIGPAWGFLQL